MILIDVQALQTGGIYDFELEEEKTPDELVAEMIALICRKESMQADEKDKFYLYAMEKECVLAGDLTLKEQGICNGERLVLI